MSGRPTSRRLAAAALALAALAAGTGAPRARADGTRDPGAPVFFRDPDTDTVREISAAIGLFGSNSPDDRERARNTLHDIGYWSVGSLLDRMKSMSQQFRSNSFLVLGRLGDARALPCLRAAVGEEGNEWPSRIAPLMLGRMRDGSDPTLAAFRDALKSRENELRKVAIALACGKLQRRRSAETGPILEGMVDEPTPNPFVKYAALLALGFHRNRVAEAAPDARGNVAFVPTRRIREALGDPREGNRLSAILALAVSRLDGLDPIFKTAFESDGNREVRRAALLALGKPRDRPDDVVTDLLVSVLEGQRSNLEERRMAAYLLMLRRDPRSVDALLRTANSPRSSDTAATAVVALGGIEDPAVPVLLLNKLSASSATVRAAAAMAATRLARPDDLRMLRGAIQKRLEQAETDASAKFDMKLAVEEIAKVLKDREDVAAGKPPAERAPPAWMEADSADLFRRLGRTHRESVLDLANLRVLQCLGIDSLFAYRNPDAGKNADIGLVDAAPGARRPHTVYAEQFDLAIEFARRPYYGAEDDPEEAPTPVPRNPR